MLTQVMISDIDSQLDEESELEIESGLAAIEPDLESKDQRLEPDLPESDLPDLGIRTRSIRRD